MLRVCSQGSLLLLTINSMTKRNSNKPRRSWNEAVLAALRSKQETVPLSYLNDYVEANSPELLKHNHNWQAKIRQIVQRLRDRGLAENVSKGMWKATPHTEDALDTAAREQA